MPHASAASAPTWARPPIAVQHPRHRAGLVRRHAAVDQVGPQPGRGRPDQGRGESVAVGTPAARPGPGGGRRAGARRRRTGSDGQGSSTTSSPRRRASTPSPSWTGRGDRADAAASPRPQLDALGGPGEQSEESPRPGLPDRPAPPTAASRSAAHVSATIAAAPCGCGRGRRSRRTTGVGPSPRRSHTTSNSTADSTRCRYGRRGFVASAWSGPAGATRGRRLVDRGLTHGAPPIVAADHRRGEPAVVGEGVGVVDEVARAPVLLVAWTGPAPPSGRNPVAGRRAPTCGGGPLGGRGLRQASVDRSSAGNGAGRAVGPGGPPGRARGPRRRGRPSRGTAGPARAGASRPPPGPRRWTGHDRTDARRPVSARSVRRRDDRETPSPARVGPGHRPRYAREPARQRGAGPGCSAGGRAGTPGGRPPRRLRARRCASRARHRGTRARDRRPPPATAGRPRRIAAIDRGRPWRRGRPLSAGPPTRPAATPAACDVRPLPRPPRPSPAPRAPLPRPAPVSDGLDHDRRRRRPVVHQLLVARRVAGVLVHQIDGQGPVSAHPVLEGADVAGAQDVARPLNRRVRRPCPAPATGGGIAVADVAVPARPGAAIPSGSGCALPAASFAQLLITVIPPWTASAAAPCQSTPICFMARVSCSSTARMVLVDGRPGGLGVGGGAAPGALLHPGVDLLVREALPADVAHVRSLKVAACLALGAEVVGLHLVEGVVNATSALRDMRRERLIGRVGPIHGALRVVGRHLVAHLVAEPGCVAGSPVGRGRKRPAVDLIDCSPETRYDSAGSCEAVVVGCPAGDHPPTASPQRCCLSVQARPSRSLVGGDRVEEFAIANSPRQERLSSLSAADLSASVAEFALWECRRARYRHPELNVEELPVSNVDVDAAVGRRTRVGIGNDRGEVCYDRVERIRACEGRARASAQSRL